MSAPTIEILAVDAHPEQSELERFRIEQPAPGARLEGHSLRIAGWAVPRAAPLEAVDVTFRHAPGKMLHRVRRLPVLERPDIAALFEHAPNARRAGFNASLSLLGLERECELVLRARLEGGGEGEIASVRVRRQPLETGFEPGLAPLLFISEGRSGSTWLAHLLGSHPSVVAFEPFRFEPRVGSYWMNVLGMLADPMSYSQALQPDFRVGNWWTGEHRQSPAPNLEFDPRFETWLAKDAVEELARFSQERIERFYARAAEEQSKPAARFFVERALGPEWFTPALVRELYPRSRALFLVRDPRDVVCSMLAHNEKTGVPSFGRRFAQTDEQFVRDIVAVRASQLLEVWQLRRDEMILVRYEDLVLEPEPTLGSLLRELGVESDPGTVRQTLERANAGRRDRQSDHMTAPDQAASVGRWREELSPSLQEVCADAFADSLREFGYA